MYITEFFYGNAGTVKYAACSFVKTPCWKYFLAFHVSIGKIDRIAYSDASVIVIKSRKSKGYAIADTDCTHTTLLFEGAVDICSAIRVCVVAGVGERRESTGGSEN